MFYPVPLVPAIFLLDLGNIPLALDILSVLQAAPRRAMGCGFGTLLVRIWRNCRDRGSRSVWIGGLLLLLMANVVGHVCPTEKKGLGRVECEAPAARVSVRWQ